MKRNAEHKKEQLRQLVSSWCLDEREIKAVLEGFGYDVDEVSI